MGKNLYVGNLAAGVDADDLKELFSTVGEVFSANVIKDRYTGQSKGFGFVEMSKDAEAQEAVQKLNNYNLKSKQIQVSEARPKPKPGGGHGPGGGGRGPGGGGGRGGGYDRDRRGGGGRY